jgi:hypothetical protein
MTATCTEYVDRRISGRMQPDPCGRPAVAQYNMDPGGPAVPPRWRSVCKRHLEVALRHYHYEVRELPV